jgi:hypothetical protein
MKGGLIIKAASLPSEFGKYCLTFTLQQPVSPTYCRLIRNSPCTARGRVNRPEIDKWRRRRIISDGFSCDEFSGGPGRILASKSFSKRDLMVQMNI